MKLTSKNHEENTYFNNDIAHSSVMQQVRRFFHLGEAEQSRRQDQGTGDIM
jgi:hypothetical protein